MVLLLDNFTAIGVDHSSISVRPKANFFSESTVIS